MDDITNQAPTDSPARGDPLCQNVATGAVKLGDEHEWRNDRFKNFLKKQRQDHSILLRNKFQMIGILESERSDDDDMEAPLYVFDDNEMTDGSKKRPWLTVVRLSVSRAGSACHI